MYKFILTFGVIVSVPVFGQVSPDFINLDFTTCLSGYFYDQVESENLPPDGTDYEYLSYDESCLFMAVGIFQISSPTIINCRRKC